MFSFSSVVKANSDHYKMRISWVKDLKILLREIESKDELLLVHHDKLFLEKFSLISHAFADSRFDCFYGGWPSKLVSHQGRKLCTNPTKGNSEYSQGHCKVSEIQCNPILFGKDLCVPFGSQKERNATFSTCEKQFEKQDDYSFLKNPSREDLQSLREISYLAGEGCLKSQTSICEKILKKLPDGLRSIEEGEKVAEMQKALTRKPLVVREEVCEEPSVLEKLDRELKKDSYSWMKKKFQESPFCNPLKVFNDDSKKAPAALIAALNKELKFFDTRNAKLDFLSPQLKRTMKRFEIPSSKEAELLKHLSNVPGASNEDQRRLHIARFKTIFNQAFLEKNDFSNLKEIASDELLGSNIFAEDDEGNAVCPFVSEDAFNKAIKGFEALKSKHGSKITKKNQITIVDYSQPSNARRLFVLDLESGEVLQNTWVAHGVGGGMAGSDGLGSSPDVSNVSGSMKSSDGFVLATKASSGSLYGPNVLLQGVDKNNSNMASRAIVLHGWSSPMSEYNQGVSEMEGDRYGSPFDINERVKKLDATSHSYKEMEKRLWQLAGSTTVPKYLAATEGCLGVPLISMEHLDPKGRSKSQLEILREDLPGSVIFNYSGENMESRYFP